MIILLGYEDHFATRYGVWELTYICIIIFSIFNRA
jgi:hypothetical protein